MKAQELILFVDQLLWNLIVHQDDCVDFLCREVESYSELINFDLDPSVVDSLAVNIFGSSKVKRLNLPFKKNSDLHDRLTNKSEEIWESVGLSIVARILFDKYCVTSSSRGLITCHDAEMSLSGVAIGHLP